MWASRPAAPRGSRTSRTIESEHDQGHFVPAPSQDKAAYNRVSSFLSALGFASGKGWNEPDSRGAAFLAPLGNLEFVEGQFPSTADVLVEVTALDAIHQAAETWIKAQGGGPAPTTLSAITETHWKSRIFTVEPEQGFAFSFWAWSDPVKGKPVAIEGDLSAAGMKFAIVVARWNAVITERLLEGALDALLRSGAKRERYRGGARAGGVGDSGGGAHDRRAEAKWMRLCTLGCLLRGETAHYEAIYNEVSRGIGQSQQETGIPHSFGVLTCETLEQALNRAGIKAGNKGFEAAVAAIEMVSLNAN